MTTPRELFVQYLVYLDHPSAPGLYSVRRFSDENDPVGRQLAAHKRIEAVRLVIPKTHEPAKVTTVAPIIEVWIEKSIPNR